MNFRTLPHLLSASLAVTGLFLSTTSTTFAAGFTKTGTYRTSKGEAGTFTEHTQRSPGEVQISGTSTNQNGLTSTWQSVRTWNEQTGAGTFSGSATLPDGKNRSRVGTVARNANGTFSEQGTFLNPKAQQGSFAEMTVKNAHGSVTTGAITKANGKIDSTQRVVTKAPGSTDVRTTVIASNGKVLTTESHTTFDKATHKGTTTVTTALPNGQSVVRTTEFTITPDPVPPKS